MGAVFDGTHRSIGSVEPVVHVQYVVLLVNLVHIATVAMMAHRKPWRADGSRTIGVVPISRRPWLYAAGRGDRRRSGTEPFVPGFWLQTPRCWRNIR